MPPDPAAMPPARLLELVQSQLAVDRSADLMGYPRTRALRELRDYLRSVGFPRTFEDRLLYSLIPCFQHDARAAGHDWTRQDAPLGDLQPIFEIDAMVMNRGRGRAELTREEFAAYLTDCRALLAEYTAIRARMHNGEE